MDNWTTPIELVKMPLLDSCIVSKQSNYGAGLSMSVYPQHSGGSISRARGEFRRVLAPSGTLSTETGNSTFYSKSGMQHIGSSKASGIDTEAFTSGNIRPLHSRSAMNSMAPRFPKLQECAHFHYERVELSGIEVTLYDGVDRNEVEPITSYPPDAVVVEEHYPKTRYYGVDDNGEDCFFTLSVKSNHKTWLIRRTFKEFCTFDQQLHKCIYDRSFSQLMELAAAESNSDQIEVLKADVTVYLARFSQLAGNLINCAPILKWLELDNRGHRLVAFDDESAINTPAVAAVHCVKRYMPQAGDELALEVGDMISVIDMPPRDESVWWRGKKELDVGFFPSDCVEVIAGHNIPSTSNGAGQSTRIPVLRRRGKLTAFFRSFLSNRPPRRRLKESGILKERVYGCDLGEHLLNTGQKVPAVLIHCSTFIEDHGIVDGVYRLSGVSSNIQRLRLEFDAEKVPDLTEEVYVQDIHSVSSVLKLYFRELPIPLLTYQLYDKFVYAVNTSEETRLLHIHDVVNQLPPPHFRTLEFLMRHLARVAAMADKTGMNSKNLAIVWAPNLLRSSEMENSVEALKGVGVCAIAVEYLIRYADLIFSSRLHTSSLLARNGNTPKCLNRPKSLAVSTPTKLLNMQEARALGQASAFDQKFIEVGEGPSNLPKYHTVIDLPSRNRRRNGGKGSVSGSEKSPSGWRNLFGPKHRKQNWPSRSPLDLTVGVLGASTLPNLNSENPKPADSSSISSEASSGSFKRRKLRSSARANSENMCSLPCVFENPGPNLASTPKDLPIIRRVPLVTLNQIIGEGNSTPNRSTSHESFFEGGIICDGFSKKLLLEQKTVDEVVRTVPCSLVEGGCLVKLNFMDCAEEPALSRFNPTFSIRESVIEEQSSVDDLDHNPVREVPVDIHYEPKFEKNAEKRLHRTLSPKFLRKYRAGETEEHPPANVLGSPGSSRLKRSLSTSPNLPRRPLDADSTLAFRPKDEKAEKDKSRRKSLRRMTLEETVDSALFKEQSVDEPVLPVEYDFHVSQDEPSQRFGCSEMEMFDAICAEIYQEVPGPSDGAADIPVTPKQHEHEEPILESSEKPATQYTFTLEQFHDISLPKENQTFQLNRQSVSSGEFSPGLTQLFTTPRTSEIFPDLPSRNSTHIVASPIEEPDEEVPLVSPPQNNEAPTSSVYFYGLTSPLESSPVEEKSEEQDESSPSEGDVMTRSVDLKALRDTFFGLPSSHEQPSQDDSEAPSVGWPLPSDSPLDGALKVQAEVCSPMSDTTSFSTATKTFDMIDLHGDTAWKENAEALKAITDDEIDASSSSNMAHLTGNNNDKKESGVDAVEYLLLLRKATLSPNDSLGTQPPPVLPSSTSQINDEDNHDSVSLCSNTDDEKISVRSLRCKFESGKRRPVARSEPTSTVDSLIERPLISGVSCEPKSAVDCLAERSVDQEPVSEGRKQSQTGLVPRESLKQKLYTLSNMYKETSSPFAEPRVEVDGRKSSSGRSDLSVKLKPPTSSFSTVQSVKTFPLTRPSVSLATFTKPEVEKPVAVSEGDGAKKPSLKVREMRRMYENAQASNEHEQRSSDGSDSPPSQHQRSGKVARLKICQQLLSSL